MDESMFGRRKYHRGRQPSGRVVSAVCCQHQVHLSLSRLTDIGQIETLIGDILNYTNPGLFESSIVLENIKETVTKLQSSISILENTEITEHDIKGNTLLPLLQFITCQLENSLVSPTKRRYNVVTQAVALKVHLISPACYRFFQSLDCLFLPTTRSLRALSSCIGFFERNRHVALNMNEVHITSDISYQGGKVVVEIDPTTLTKKVLP
ncbi:hypothetical protein LOD99_11114 [Oopsacas minuta]|uniref:Uncharacterized protein n=1 Tax=Oopsacas minuta TaxID=111878 RepID=A0AAV7KAI3_9METZ|nr:hypothetical protein LOD99_11114 [Oopsacas minuta]